MATNLLIHGDYNVIVVDWGGGASLPLTQATANIRLVALEIAFLVRTLVVRYRKKRYSFLTQWLLTFPCKA